MGDYKDYSIPEINEKLANHYTEKYLKSSAQKEVEEYHEAMGWNAGPQLQMHSTFEMNRTHEEPHYNASRIEGDGDPYANVIPNYEPTIADSVEPESFGSWPDSGLPSDYDRSGSAGGSPKRRNRGTFSAPKRAQGTYDVPAKRQGTYAVPAKGNGTYAVPVDASGSGKQGTAGSVDLDSTSLFLEKLYDHYTEKYLESSAGVETKQYHQRMGFDGDLQKQSTFERGARKRDPDFSLSGIEREGDPYANVVANCEPTVYEAWDSGSYDTFYSEVPSSFEDGGGGGGGGGRTYDGPAKLGATYDGPAKLGTTYDGPAKLGATYDGPAKLGATYDGPAKLGATYDKLPGSSGRSKSPARDSGPAASSCECSSGATEPAVRYPMQRHSSFDAGSNRAEPDFDVSAIEHEGGPFDNLWQGSPSVSGMTSSNDQDACSEVNRRLQQSSVGTKQFADLIEELAECVQRKDRSDGSTGGRVPSETSGGGYDYLDRNQRQASMRCDREEFLENQRYYEQERDPFASGIFQGGAKEFDPNASLREEMATLDRNSPEYRQLETLLAEAEGRPMGSQPDPNASLREEMAMLDKNSPEYRQLETLLAEAEGCPCDGKKPAGLQPPRQVPQLTVTPASPAAAAPKGPRLSRIPAPAARAQPAQVQEPAQRGRPVRRGIPVPLQARAKPCPGIVTNQPKAIVNPRTMIVQPKAKAIPSKVQPRALVDPRAVTNQPRAKAIPSKVTVQPRARVDPGTVTVKPRAQPQAWPRYDPSKVVLRPVGPRSGEVSPRPRSKSAMPTPRTGSACPAARQSRYQAGTYRPAQGSQPRSSGSDQPRWRGANAPPPAMSRPPSLRYMQYPLRSRTTLTRQTSHERSRSAPPPQKSTPRPRAALGPPRVTGYDERVGRKEPRPHLFQSPAVPSEDPNASLRAEMADMDQDSPEYQQLAQLLAEAEGCPCDGSKQSDPNASLREEMAQLDKSSPEYQQLETQLVEAEGRPSPVKYRPPATANDAIAFIRGAMQEIPHDSVQYAKLMVMLMDLQGWDGNARPPEPEVEDPCEYIKEEMRNTDRNSSKYIQLEQMLLECEGGDSFVGSPRLPPASPRSPDAESDPNASLREEMALLDKNCSEYRQLEALLAEAEGQPSPPKTRERSGSPPRSPKTQFLRAREDYYRNNPTVGGKRPTGMRKFSEKYPRPDIDYDPLAGPPDYSAFFADDSLPSSSANRSGRNPEWAWLDRNSSYLDPPQASATGGAPEFDERMRFHATSPRRADRMQHVLRPKEPEFHRDYIHEDLTLQNPSCYCGKKEKEPVFAKNRSLPFEEDLEPRYSR